MSEDEFDFAGQNPGELLATDERAQPFDYHARLSQKGYTKNSSPNTGELFLALATEYVPTVVVNLPPKVVERVKLVRRPGDIVRRCLWVLFCLAGPILNLILSYQGIVDFVRKANLQPARCTITSVHINYSSDDAGNETYSPVLSFILHTPKGQSYRVVDSDPPTFISSDDTRSYLSRYSVNHSYSCWYSPSRLDLVRFARELTWSDYAWFVLSILLSLLGFVLPIVMYILSLWMSFVWRRRRGA